MSLRKLLVCLFIACCWTAVVTSAKSKLKETQIIKEFVPDECSEVAEAGDEVHVHYTGMLESGSVFDTSRQEGRGPLPFVLGQNRVIQGWEQGIKGMCVGEKRKLIIPSNLAYGRKGHPPVIPPDATLKFETELVSIRKKSPTPDVLFRTIRFLIIPFGIVCALYYVYNKNKKAPTKRETSRCKKR